MLFLMCKNIEMGNAAWMFFQAVMIDTLYFNKLKLAYGTLYNSETAKTSDNLALSILCCQPHFI